MSDEDPPPPYTATDEKKINHSLQPTASASVSINLQDGQALPPATSGYETVAYYPASSSVSTSVLLQPQQQEFQQQQPQVIVIQSPQVVVVPPVEQQQQQHIWLSVCSFFCLWSCLCSTTAFILARKSALCEHNIVLDYLYPKATLNYRTAVHNMDYGLGHSGYFALAILSDNFISLSD